MWQQIEYWRPAKDVSDRRERHVLSVDLRDGVPTEIAAEEPIPADLEFEIGGKTYGVVAPAALNPGSAADTRWRAGIASKEEAIRLRGIAEERTRIAAAARKAAREAAMKKLIADEAAAKAQAEPVTDASPAPAQAPTPAPAEKTRTK